jgi:predicted transcriptional regulator
MPRPRASNPTDVELQILRVLWSARAPQSLGQIHAALGEHRPVAKTTVATMLGVMLDKKLVRRTSTDRGYTWSAATDRTKAAAGLLGKLLDYVFDGSAQRMVAHLVDEGQISPDELEVLWRLHAQKSAAKKRKERGS